MVSSFALNIQTVNKSFDQETGASVLSIDSLAEASMLRRHLHHQKRLAYTYILLKNPCSFFFVCRSLKRDSNMSWKH